MIDGLGLVVLIDCLVFIVFVFINGVALFNLRCLFLMDWIYSIRF